VKYFEEIIKPFQQHHFVNSASNLLKNNITATEYGSCNRVRAGIKLNLESAEFSKKAREQARREFGDLHEPPAEDTPVYGIYKRGGILDVGIFQADDDIAPYAIKTKSIILEDSTGRTHRADAPRQGLFKWFNDPVGFRKERNRALCYLIERLKRSYQGSLTIIGDPSIHPHDAVHLIDHINDMYGTVNVREVIHSFSHETGFVTEIVPDMKVIADNLYDYRASVSMDLEHQRADERQFRGYREAQLTDPTFASAKEHYDRVGTFSFKEWAGIWGRTAYNMMIKLVPPLARKLNNETMVQVIPLVRPRHGNYLQAGLTGAFGADPFTFDRHGNADALDDAIRKEVGIRG